MNFISFCKSVDHWNPPEIDQKDLQELAAFYLESNSTKQLGRLMVGFFLAKGSPKKDSPSSFH